MDALDPYVLLVHQGMIEDVFIKDLASRGVNVERNMAFVSCIEDPHESYRVDTLCRNASTGEGRVIRAKFVIGCDGAHSRVRKSIPEVQMVGDSGKSAWGVIDGSSSFFI